MFWSLAKEMRSRIRLAPSSIEYSEWQCKCAKGGPAHPLPPPFHRGDPSGGPCKPRRRPFSPSIQDSGHYGEGIRRCLGQALPKIEATFAGIFALKIGSQQFTVGFPLSGEGRRRGT